MEQNSKDIKKAVIVGGGLIGIEMAEMLHSRNIEVTFLVRESSFWNNVLPNEESSLVNRHIKNHGIDLQLSTELKEIVGNGNERVKSVITQSGEEIPCQFVGLTVGVSPNINFLKDSEIETDKGVLVNEYLETNISNIYAIGDCAQFKNSPGENRRNIEQVWYTGRMHGETLAQTICAKKTAYQPGNWFNSAKFLDIEYQTYGWVFPKLKDNETDFYWEDTTEEKALHFVFDKEEQTFIGINTFGIRLRHDVFDQWLNENRSIHYVVENFQKANFDPEFYKNIEQDLIAEFNSKFGTTLKSKQKSGLFGLFK
jgi:NADPH-dependent 2,4-dienoyl-CoA reductase/sulfur reductase-like enzyme